MVQPSQRPSGGEIRVCPGCGAIAPVGLPQCTACGEALGLRNVPAPLPLANRAWARVELTLPCPRCSAPVSPRPESVDGTIACGRCGETSPVDPATWDEVVHLAHAAVDLSQPDPQGHNAALGAWNPFADLGIRASCAALPSERITPQSRLAMRVGPGAPLCPRCRGPIHLNVLQSGRLATECLGCGDRDAFAMPADLARRVPALRALLAFSPHSAEAAGRVEPWWILVEGPSTMRSLIATQRAEAERQAAEQAQWDAWQLQERERKEREAQLEAASAERARQERERKEREARTAAERDRAARELQETRGRLESTERALADARAQVERAAQERQQLDAARAADHATHAQMMEQVRAEAGYHLDQARAAMAQRDAEWRAREEAQRKAQEELTRKHKRRWGVAVALWVVLFLAVAADLALALLK